MSLCWNHNSQLNQLRVFLNKTTKKRPCRSSPILVILIWILTSENDKHKEVVGRKATFLTIIASRYFGGMCNWAGEAPCERTATGTECSCQWERWCLLKATLSNLIIFQTIWQALHSALLKAYTIRDAKMLWSVLCSHN